MITKPRSGFKRLVLTCLALMSLSLTLTQVQAQAVPAGTACTSKRMRKSWDLYSDAEKTRYIAAVALAMKQGYHQKFIELHTEYLSEKEAHNNCMFIYWHRMFILGYENMLRSLGPDYICVTLPVWDHLTNTANRASGACANFENCSRVLVDFGGTQTGRNASNIVYNVTVPLSTARLCINKGLPSNFCGNNSGCANCILRGKAHQKVYPASAYFTSVYQQVFTYNTWANFFSAVETGVHNSVHSAMDGVMAYFQSPVDPVFYTHHAFIDALQTIYLKCQNGAEGVYLTADQKANDTRFLTQCARRTSGTFKGSDKVTMRTRAYNTTWVHVRTEPKNILYPFFKDLPATFAEYVDAKDLGIYSYTYTFSGALTNMYTNCKASNTMSSAVLLADKQEKGGMTPTLEGATENDSTMRHWTIALYESARLNGYSEDGARDQMELIMCAHKDECLGGVVDFTETFRKNFNVTGHPRCYQLLRGILDGTKVIGVPGWRDITDKFLPCPTTSPLAGDAGLQVKSSTTTTAVTALEWATLLIWNHLTSKVARTLRTAPVCSWALPFGGTHTWFQEDMWVRLEVGLASRDAARTDGVVAAEVVRLECPHVSQHATISWLSVTPPPLWAIFSPSKETRDCSKRDLSGAKVKGRHWSRSDANRATAQSDAHGFVERLWLVWDSDPTIPGFSTHLQTRILRGTKMKRGVIAFLALVCLSLTLVQVQAQDTTEDTSPPAGTACTSPRVRKSWDLFTDAEKATYISAVALAMKTGYHQKFVELHTDFRSELEAHKTCMFIYWHRRFILGYENMLRTLAPEYACVTIPVWDHLTNTAKRASGTCDSFANCSQVLQDFGGTTIGKTSSLKVYNVTIPATTSWTCITNGLPGNFCGNNSACAGCIPRGKSHLKAYPAEAYFTSVYQQVFTYSTWSKFASAIENGVHNTVHSTIDGTMAYFQSPIDPVFFTHHGFIDALQTIYLKCQNGAEGVFLTADQKANDARFFTQCARRSSGNFSGSDPITMRTRDFDTIWVDVVGSPDNMLYPFFKSMPKTFAEYVDAKDLGVYSYTYTFSGALSNMYTNCKASNTISAAVLLADTKAKQAVDSITPTIEGASETDDTMRRWTIALYESARLNGYSAEGARAQMELIMCAHKDECLGGVADITETFRENFGVTGHPRCYSLLQQIIAGTKVIGVPGWRDITDHFLPCTATTPSDEEADLQVTATITSVVQ